MTGSEVLASASSSGDIYLHSNKVGGFVEAAAFKMQEGINCIRVSENAGEYCRMAACTNGGTLAYKTLYLEYGICSAERIDRSGRPPPRPRLKYQ